MQKGFLEHYPDLSLSKLACLYDSAKTDLAIADGKVHYLSDSIVPEDVFAISGAGASVMTNCGELLDLSSMTVNCILGQNDPWVKLKQVAYLLSDRPSFHTTKLGSEIYYSLPKRLATLRVGGIDSPIVSHRQCNGSDATELAIQAAYNERRGRRLLVSFEGSYHGQNLTAYLVSSVQKQHMFLLDSCNVEFLPAPPISRRLVSKDELSEVESEGLNKLESRASATFAIILEPIQMNNGVRPFSGSFLQEIRAICNRHEICLIYDEVQTGFGWLGHLSAAEYSGVIPDIACFSKALTAGNGPLALTVCAPRYRGLKYGSASKTSGADVRSLVAADAVLDRLLGLDEESIPDFVGGELRKNLLCGLLSTVPAKGQLLEICLGEVARRCEGIVGHILGEGLIRGIEILTPAGEANAEMATKIANDCFHQGLLIRNSGHVLIIKPPLVITRGQLARATEILDAVICSQMKGPHRFR